MTDPQFSTRRETNDEQHLFVVDGDQATAVVAIDATADPDDALSFVDEIEAEVASSVNGLRVTRRSVVERVRGML